MCSTCLQILYTVLHKCILSLYLNSQAQQEVIAAAMKTALSEQRAMHQDCVKAVASVDIGPSKYGQR